MAEPSSTWNVLDHGPLERLADNLWRVEGAVPRLPLRRQMLVVRLDGGRLLIFNGVAVRDDVRAEIEALGTPTYLIVPNAWHRLDAPAFKARYPDLKVYCPARGRRKVGQVVPIDGTYDDFPDEPSISFEHLEGSTKLEGVMKVRCDDGVTLVFGDALFNQPHLKGLHGIILRLIGSSGGPRVTRMARFAIVKDRTAFKAHLLRLADTEGLNRLVPAHIDVIHKDAAAVLRSVAQRL